MNQKERILTYLQHAGSISSIEAFERFKITRLSAVIFNLKQDGYRFRTEDIETSTVGQPPVKYSLL